MDENDPEFLVYHNEDTFLLPTSITVTKCVVFNLPV